MCYLSFCVSEFKFIELDLRDLYIVGAVCEILSCSDQGASKILEEYLGK